MRKRLHSLCGSILIILLLSGCWDVISIEERGLIVGMAIDIVEGEEATDNQLTVTAQFAVPPGLGNPAQTGGGGAPYMNLSADGNSIDAITQKIANQTNKIPFFEHLKVVVISEEVASTPGLMADVLDIFIRNRDTHRGIDVIISKDKAKDILEIEPENEMLPIMYIYQLLEKNLKETNELKNVKLGDIHEYLLTQRSFVLTEVANKEKLLEETGGTVYNGEMEKIIGKLELEEMFGLNLVTEDNVRGPIEVEIEGGKATFAIREASSTVSVQAKNPEETTITITIKLEGELQETFGGLVLDDIDSHLKLEKKVASKTEEIVEKVTNKAQQELETDIFGFLKDLKKSDYKSWKKVKDDWEKGNNYFINSDISVNAIVEVRAHGVINKSNN